MEAEEPTHFTLWNLFLGIPLRISFLKSLTCWWSMVAHPYNPSTGETKAGGLL